MENNKNIELLLKARLDAAEAITGAEDLGKKMAASFAGAFDSIGEEIAKKVLEAAKRNLSGATLSSGSDFLTRNQGWASQIPNIGAPANTVPTNALATSTASVAGAITSGLPPQAAATTGTEQIKQQSAAASESGVGRILATGGYGAGVHGFGGLLQLAQAGALTSGVGDDNARAVATDQYLSASSTADKAALFMRMRRAGIEANPDRYISREALNSGIGSAESVLESSSGKLADLIDKIDELNKTFTEANGNAEKQAETQKDLIRALEEKNAIETHQQAAVRDLNTMKQMQQTAYATEQAPTGLFGTREGAMRAVSAAGFGAQVLAEAPGLYRHASATMARYGNLESRAMASGDIDRLLAVQALGGQGSVNTFGTIEGGAKSVVSAGVQGTLGYMGGTAAAAAMGLGPAGVLGLGIAGAGMAAYNALSSTSSRIGGSIEDRIQTELGVNQEYYDMNRAGRGAAVGAYRGAQSMGSPELSRFLVGGQDATLYQERADRSSREASQKEERMRRLVEYAGPSAVNSQRYQRYQSSVESLRGEAERDTSEAASASRMMVPGLDGRATTLRQYSANFIGPQAFDSLMGDVAGRMGGVFAGEAAPRLEYAGRGVRSLIQAQGAGLSNAAEVAGGLFMGGMGRETSMTKTLEGFSDAVASGLDKAKVGQALQVMATQASSGLGAAVGAQADFTRGLGVAQSVFGDKIEGQEMDFVQRTMQGNRDMTRSSGGFGAVAGMMGAMGVESKLKKELGKDFKGFSYNNLMEIQRFSGTYTDDATAQLLKDSGMDPSKLGPMQITKITSMLNQAGPEGLQKALSGLGKEGERSFDITSGQGRTAEEAQRLAEVRRADASGLGPKRVVDFDPSKPSTATGAEEARAFDKAEADKVVKGVVTLGDTIGSLKSALDGVIKRANEVLNNPPMPRGAGVPRPPR